MKILIDADGCPVVDLTVSIAGAHNVPCTILCDTAHEFFRSGADTVIVSKGADSADYAIVSRAGPNDIVVTQDYGLAAMCLARRAIPIRQDGFVYSDENIDSLLAVRHAAKKARMAGVRIKGPAKRTAAQDRDFADALTRLLERIP